MVLRNLEFVGILLAFMCDKHIYECPSLVWNSSWHVSYSSVQEVSPETIRQDILSVGVYSLPVVSPFRAMKWKNSIDAAISYPSGNPVRGFSPLLPSHPLLLHLPHVLRMHVKQRRHRPFDLCPCGYRERTKWIVCMCSIFIAHASEKWAHPFPFGYSPFSRFLSPDTTNSPFLKVEHLGRVILTAQPQERQGWGACRPRWHRERGPRWVSLWYCS